MDDVIAIIPARSGSKSVKDKNIALVSDVPLIAYSIAAAQLSKRISRVIVSTDSERYAELSMRFGAEVPFLRPSNIARDRSTDREWLFHAINWINENETYLPEYWVHLRPTTPLRSPEVIDKAIAALIADREATALRSAHKAPESPAKWFRKGSDGYVKTLIDDSDGKEIFNLPRQLFPNVYIPDGYVDIIKTSHILNQSTLYGQRLLFFESPVCTEIDSQEELEYIQYQISKHGSTLLDHIVRNHL